jgi:hypothetical protein
MCHNASGILMIEIQIDITDLEDARLSNNSSARKNILSAAKEVIESGGRVVLKRSYSNAPDDIFKVYGNSVDIDRDWATMFPPSG